MLKVENIPNPRRTNDVDVYTTDNWIYPDMEGYESATYEEILVTPSNPFELYKEVQQYSLLIKVVDGKEPNVS